MTKNPIDIVRNIINDPFESDEIISEALAIEIVCNEEAMKIADKAPSGWLHLFNNCHQNAQIIIAGAALNRAVQFKDAMPFLYISLSLHKKALDVMETYALTSEDFLFLAENHEDGKKKKEFLSKGIGYAKNYKESLVALRALLKSKTFDKKEEDYAWGQDLICAGISKTISLATEFKEEAYVYVLLERTYGFDCKKDNKFKIFFESIIKNREINFFGKKTIEEFVKIGTPSAIINAGEIFKAIKIIEQLKDMSETNIFDNESKDVFKRFYQNNP